MSDKRGFIGVIKTMGTS